MKRLQQFISKVFLILFVFGFSQCNTPKSKMNITKTIQTPNNKKTPQVYYQSWVAGVQGGGSGINLFFSKEVLGDKVPLQVYFRNQITNVEEKPQHYVARYKGKSNQLKDYSMNSNKEGEYGNKIPETALKFPFELLENEAVVSYVQNNKTEYLKFTDISEKEMLAYPSAPPQR